MRLKTKGISLASTSVVALCVVVLAVWRVQDVAAREQLDRERQKAIGSKIDHLFGLFEREQFPYPESTYYSAGWEMSLPSGKTVGRGKLMGQAEAAIIPYGKEVVPHLFKWVRSDNLPVRYVAIFSLQQITGLHPWTPYFDREDKEGNREKAIRVWKDWYEKQQ